MDGVQKLVEGCMSVGCGGVSERMHVAFEIGEGNRVRLWYDPRSGHLPLKDLYPSLFECSADREVLVSDVLDPQMYGMVRSWNLCFHRDFHDWEMRQCILFLIISIPRCLGGRG